MTYTYNRDGSVASIVTTNNIDNTSETTSYTYYLNGNLKTETLPDNTTKTYTYNNRDMLVTEALSTGKTTTYAYNNSGNRTSKTVTQNSQNTVTSYTYDNANRLTQEQTGSTSISYTYDDNGRLISRTSGSVTDTFAYNGYNEMKKAVVGGVTTDYTYYVDGLRRSKKTGNNTSYEFWDGDNIIADTVSGYTIANNYIRGLRLAEINDGTATRQYTFNAHGDVTGLVDTTTGAVTDYTYDAYGNEDNASATDTNPFRYSGEYYDAETGFIYLRARYYDPSIGRFTAEDPIRDGTNWYVYCNNNPVMYIDPWGLSGILADGSYHITHPLDHQLLKLKQEYEEASPERREQIAEEARTIRRSGKQGVDWSVLAERPLNYYMIDVDVTERLDALIKISEAENWWKRFVKTAPATNVARYADFALMVRPGGKYDLKSKTEWQGKEHFIYNGETIWYDEPGNILYGHLGKVMGFEDIILKSAGGAVQIATNTSSWSYVSSYFDDPRDQRAIQKGIDIFKNTHSWLWW